MQKIWKVKKPNIESSARMAAKLRISSMLAQLLTARGIEDEGEAFKFLHPNLDMMHSPFLMRGMEQAVERIKKAIENDERIWIYGDYDVDGTTATSLLLGVFKHLGAAPNYYIPNRFDEGYGLNKDAITMLSEKGCDLMISVDCGISSIAEVEHANKLGIDIIITDHHEPKNENIPPAYVVLNPRLKDCEYPFDGLAGVGVAFKLAHALLSSQSLSAPMESGCSTFLRTQLDLVALGTVVDVASLVDENRILSKFGLEELNKRTRVGIRALCDAIEYDTEKEITSYALGYVLGPRLNAAGRLDTATKVVELLTTDSYEYALNIAKELDAENRKRQEIEHQILEHAKDKIKRSVDLNKEKAIVLADEQWHQGVIGIVASRLVELHYRPTLLIALEGDEGHGSGRSIPEFNLFEGLNKCKELMTAFGGHKAAAGLNINKNNIQKLRDKFSHVVASQLSEQDLTPKIDVDLQVSIPQLTMQAIEELNLMEPFGMGNPRPVMAISDVSINNGPNLFGKNNAHLKFTISDLPAPQTPACAGTADRSRQAGGRQNLETIGWRMAPLMVALKNKNISLDIAFQPEINEWKNSRSVQIKIDDIHINSPKGKGDIYPPLDVPSPVKIFDRRNCDKPRYLRKLLERKERTFLYVRNNAALQQLAVIVDEKCEEVSLGLCSPELNHEQIQEILEQFDSGQLTAVASSVILESLPYVKHFVFCHPVPTLDIFFDCCKPVFDTEETTYIHLIFSAKDVRFMQDMLNWKYPDREALEKLYKLIKGIAKNYGISPFEKGAGGFVELKRLTQKASSESIKKQTVKGGVVILEELKLLERQNSSTPTIHLLSKPQQKRGLDESEFFLRGEQLRQAMLPFSDFILKKTPEEIWKELSRVRSVE